MTPHQRLSDPALLGWLDSLQQACRQLYGPRLVTLALYGSRARGSARPDSDVDLLAVVRELPPGRLRRVREFEPVRLAWAGMLAREQRPSEVELSVIFKTPSEVDRGSPLFFDLVEDAVLLVDEGGFFAGFLRGLAERMQRLGARRIWRGSSWYWDLKPDYRAGEVFEI